MRTQTVTIDRRKPAEVVPQDKCWAIALFAGLIATILACEPIRFESIGICVQLFIHFVLESRGQHHNIMHLRVTTTLLEFFLRKKLQSKKNIPGVSSGIHGYTKQKRKENDASLFCSSCSCGSPSWLPLCAGRVGPKLVQGVCRQFHPCTSAQTNPTPTPGLTLTNPDPNPNPISRTREPQTFGGLEVGRGDRVLWWRFTEKYPGGRKTPALTNKTLNLYKGLVPHIGRVPCLLSGLVPHIGRVPCLLSARRPLTIQCQTTACPRARVEPPDCRYTIVFLSTGIYQPFAAVFLLQPTAPTRRQLSATLAHPYLSNKPTIQNTARTPDFLRSIFNTFFSSPRQRKRKHRYVLIYLPQRPLHFRSQ